MGGTWAGYTGGVRCVCAPALLCVCVCVWWVSVSERERERECALPEAFFKCAGAFSLLSAKGLAEAGRCLDQTCTPYPASPGWVMGEKARQQRMEPPTPTLRCGWWMGGPLQLALCCDKQQMFSNNVYRPGLHLQMTHTCFQSNRPRETIHPQSPGWPLHHWIGRPHVALGATAGGGATNEELARQKVSGSGSGGSQTVCVFTIPLHTAQLLQSCSTNTK